MPSQINRAVLNCTGMVYPKRGSATPNVIKLTFDFDTLDRLKACAASRKVDSHRCAYELIQEALGIRAAPPATSSPDVQPDDPLGHAMRSGLAAITNRPQGNR